MVAIIVSCLSPVAGTRQGAAGDPTARTRAPHSEDFHLGTPQTTLWGCMGLPVLGGVRLPCPSMGKLRHGREAVLGAPCDPVPCARCRGRRGWLQPEPASQHPAQCRPVQTSDTQCRPVTPSDTRCGCRGRTGLRTPLCVPKLWGDRGHTTGQDSARELGWVPALGLWNLGAQPGTTPTPQSPLWGLSLESTPWKRGPSPGVPVWGAGVPSLSPHVGVGVL